MRQINVALLGFGTVNRGLFKVIENRKSALYQLGYEIIVKAILVRDVKKTAAFFNENSPLITDEIDTILEDDDIELVFEALSGANPSARYIQNLLERGKFVISANKAAIAENYDELMSTAFQNRKRLYFEAAVCAGTPVVHTLEKLTKVDEIVSVEGILNGTTNYILNKMALEGLSYENVLAEAKALGYAEADESADVDGFDAANKLAILSNLAFGETTEPELIKKESIRNIEGVKKGTKIVSCAKRADNGEIVHSVKRVNVASSHPFYAISASQNVLKITCKTLGDIILTGPGAGGLETGTAMYLDFTRLIEEKRL